MRCHAFALVTLAAGFAAVMQTPAAAQMFPETDWSGLFVGAYGQAGVAHAQDDDADGLGDLNEFNGGVIGGFQMQLLSAVIGLEGDYGGSAFSGQFGAGTVEEDDEVALDALAGLRGRIGFAFGSAQMYATGGLALAHAKDSGGENEQWLGGYSYGAGLEYALTDNISLDAKVLRSTLFAPDWAQLSVGDAIDADSVRLGVNFRF